MIAVSGDALTPAEGDAYIGGPGVLATRRELIALFDVIGTPAWACIENVPAPAWRHYLRKIPGRCDCWLRWCVRLRGWAGGWASAWVGVLGWGGRWVGRLRVWECMISVLPDDYQMITY